MGAGRMTDGRWYLPTRRRIAKLTAFFASAKETGMTTPGSVVVQEDEFNELQDQYLGIQLPANWEYSLTHAEGMGPKFKELWPEIKDRDWMGWLVDDLVCETPNWDTILLSGLNGKNFVSAWDGGQKPERMCVPVFSKALLEAVGCVYPPGFFHTYLDDVWEHLGRSTGCWQMMPDVKLNHHHGFKTTGWEPSDETEKVSYSHIAEDKLAFDRWMRYVAKPTIARIKMLQNGP